MSAIGSWARFIISLVLAFEVIRMQLSGSASPIALLLAIILIILSALYFVFRI